ncbi:MAG TPA: ribonuclease P protein component [Alphaproteobacteria bacterium]|nr:ribonuclease P protein component [Alphaproteobacteria bacterium]MCB9985766.1 ribonuclease P protein component [Micavibrio sp.]HRK97602.1 ribonuclease P protein component [Alphaproteobacteria bacterium]
MRATKADLENTSRLVQQAAFDSLRKTKKRWVSKGFALQVIPQANCDGTTEQDEPSSDPLGFCIIASKKTARQAVLRNRMRRRLKAVALEILPRNAQMGMHYMIVARRDALTLGVDELRRDMVWCLKRLDLLKNGS